MNISGMVLPLHFSVIMKREDFRRRVSAGNKKTTRPEKSDEEAVIDAWNALLLRFPPERIELLKELKKQYRLFLYQ